MSNCYDSFGGCIEIGDSKMCSTIHLRGRDFKIRQISTPLSLKFYLLQNDMHIMYIAVLEREILQMF